MFFSLKRFMPLWERRAATRRPVVYYFVEDPSPGQFRCYAGTVKRVRRSRAFVNHSPVYGVLRTIEPVPSRVAGGSQEPARVRSGRLMRARLLDRIARVPLAEETVAAVSGVSAASAVSAAEPMVAAGESGAEGGAVL